LTDVITVLGSDVQIKSTVQASLDALLNATVPTSSGGSSTSSTSGLAEATKEAVNGLLAQAQSDYLNAEAALTAGGTSSLAQYQTDIVAMEQALQQAQELINPAGATTPTTSTTTTTTVPKKKGKTGKVTSSALAGSPPGHRA
jgi:hypothetical protein